MNEEQYLYDSIEQNREINNLPRWQLDLQQELLKFKLSLLGLVPNETFGLEIEKEGKVFTDMREYVPLLGANLVNEKGATAIHNKLSSELTKIPSDTNFNEQVIGTELAEFDKDFSVWLFSRSDDFELSDKDYWTICESAIRLVKGAMYRSLGGWKGELINNNIQQREIIQNNNTEVERQKSRMFNFMGGR